MDSIISVILTAGRSAIDIALYTLLPIMVVMMAIMKLLDSYGILNRIAKLLAPLLKPFGLPGLGVFAVIKILFVSFAAPVATFSLMHQNNTSRRYIAATLAMVMTISQANVVFPMLAVGLNLEIIMLSSILGGLVAASSSFYLFGRHLKAEHAPELIAEPTLEHPKKNPIQIMIDGGTEGTKLVIAAIPMLILALCLVNVLKASHAIDLLVWLLSAPLAWLGLPDAAVLPIVTKIIAGGTAFMGVSMELINQGQLSAMHLNKMAGLVIHPLDIVGVAVFALAGSRVASIIRIAIYGALIGILFRTIFHLLWF